MARALNIEKMITKVLRPTLTSKCNCMNHVQSDDPVLYKGVPCRVDGSGTDYVTNPDGTIRQNNTRHFVYVDYEHTDEAGEVIAIDPEKIKRIKVTDGSVADKSRQFLVRDLISNSDTRIYTFVCESNVLVPVVEP